MLSLRLLLFAGVQGTAFLVLRRTGADEAWNESSRYWVIYGLIVNFMIAAPVVRILRKRYFGPGTLQMFQKSALSSTLFRLPLLLILAMAPNILLSILLFGSPDGGSFFLFRPYTGVLAIGILWALTQGLFELPFYILICLPRLESRIGNSSAAPIITGFFLALQHIALPLLFEPAYLLWRFGMFLPFSLVIVLLCRRKPEILPWMMAVHMLMDISAVVMYLV